MSDERPGVEPRPLGYGGVGARASRREAGRSPSVTRSRAPLEEKSRDEGNFVRGASNRAEWGTRFPAVTTTRRREAPALAEAFERLVRRHRSEIFRTVFRLSRNREDAEDLTQITFMNAYTALQRGAQPDAPRAWLHAIARNAGSRRYRQQRLVEVELEDELARSPEEDVPTTIKISS